MRRSLASRKYYIAGLIATFVITCLIVTGVVFLCRHTKPGQIIPSTLSSRGGAFDEDIIGQNAIEASDCISFKNGELDPGVILDDYCDPFFFAGSLLPADSLEVFFTAVYVIKLGAAAALMYSFLRRRLTLKRTFAMLLGIAYALSSRVIFTASLSQALNVVMLMPLALSLIFNAARKKTVICDIFVAVITFLMCVCGTAGTLSGTLFIAAAALLVCLALTPSVKHALAGWGRILIAEVLGISCALFVIIPRFASYGMTYDFMQLIDERKVYYSLFDQLSTVFCGVGGSLDYSAVPTLYFGIFPLMLLIMIFFNRKIPARIKYASFLLIALTHISCAVSVVDRTLTFFGQSSIVTDLRLIGLYAMISFLAGLCLINIDGLSDTAVLASTVFPVIALIIFNGMGGAVSYNITSLYLPGIVILVLGYLVWRFRKDFLPRKLLYPFFALGIVLIFANTFIIYSTGSVEPGDVSASFAGEETYEQMNLFTEDGFSMFGSGEEKYLVVPAEGRNLTEPAILPVFLDSVSFGISGEDLFTKKEFEVISEDEISDDGTGYFTADSDSVSLVIEVTKDPGEVLFVYCGFDGEDYLEEDDGETCSSISIDGAFLKQLTRLGSLIDVTLEIDGCDTVTAPIEVLSLNKAALDKMSAAEGTIDKRTFKVEDDLIGQGEQYLLTNIPYDEDYEVYVNSDKVLTYSVQNLLAVRFEQRPGTSVEVRITKGPQAPFWGVAASAAGFAAAAAVFILREVIDRRKDKRVRDLEESGKAKVC